MVGQWGIDPPPQTDEIYSLAARATSFTDPYLVRLEGLEPPRFRTGT